MAETHTRQAKRTPVTLKIKFKSSTLDQFIERYSVDVSHGGIFIRTKDPLAVGTQLRFEFQLKDASPLIRGEGTVVWTREHDPGRSGVAPGMGVRFDRLADGSQEVLDKILAQKTTKGTKSKHPSFNETPTKVAPSPLAAGLAKESKEPKLGNMAPKPDSFGSSSVEHTGSDATPLPSPMPFHSDADDFPEEAFEEATKVAALDELAAKSIREDLEDEEAPAEASSAPVDELARRRAEREAAEKKEAEEQAAAEADAEAKSAAEAEEARERETAAAAEARAEDEKAAAEAREKAEEKKAEEKKAEARKAEEKRERKPAAAATEPPSEQSEPKTSGITYVLAAAIILVIGGGAYWYMTRDKGKESVADNSPAAADDMVAAGEAPGETDTEPAAAMAAESEEPEDVVPEVETFAASVTVKPEGATVETADGTMSSEAPASMDLESGTTHVVRVSAPGYLPKDVEVSEENPEVAVELEAKPRIIRITSTPEGAVVVLKGRRVKGTTPVDVPVTKRLERDALALVVNKRGFRRERTTISGTEGFVEGDEAMVQEINVDLDAAVAARTPKPDRKDEKDGARKVAKTDKTGKTGDKTDKKTDKKADTSGDEKTDKKADTSGDKKTDKKADTKDASGDEQGDTKTDKKGDTSGDTKTDEKGDASGGEDLTKDPPDETTGPKPDWLK